MIVFDYFWSLPVIKHVKVSDRRTSDLGKLRVLNMKMFERSLASLGTTKPNQLAKQSTVLRRTGCESGEIHI